MNDYILYGAAALGFLILFSDQIAAGYQYVVGWAGEPLSQGHDHESLEDMVSCYLQDNADTDNAEAVRQVIREVSSHCYLKEIEQRLGIKQGETK